MVHHSFCSDGHAALSTKALRSSSDRPSLVCSDRPSLYALIVHHSFALIVQQSSETVRASHACGAQGFIDRFEFLEICIERLWHYDLGMLRIAADNFAVAQKIVADGPNRYWKRIAQSIDSYMGHTLPLCHMAFVAMLLNITFHDDYDTSTQPMRYGLLSPSISSTQLVMVQHGSHPVPAPSRVLWSEHTMS
jgi:hypothetical protein